MNFYSHPATRQDEWVFAKKTKGYYIEVGAFDGQTHSNTMALEENGWHGLLIEGNPEVIPKLISNRGEHQIVHAVVAHKRTQTKFVIGGQYSGIERCMPDDWVAEHIRRGNKTLSVKTETLGDIYRTRFISRMGEYIDYLSLDTEGGEDLILKSFRGHLKNVGLITVEFRYDHPFLARLVDILEPTHRLEELRGFDACFVNLQWPSRSYALP